MAGTKREVELIIKARDQARAAVEGIVGSLRDLADAQSDVADSSQRTNALLGRLGSEFQNLQRQAAALTSLSRVANNLDRASSSVARLESNLSNAQQDLVNVSLRASQAATTLSVLEQEASQASAELQRQRGVLAGTAAEQNRLNNEVSKAGARYAALRRELLQSEEASDELRNSVRDQRDSLVALIEAQTRQNAAVAAQEQTVNRSAAAYRNLERDIKLAQNATRSANIEFDKTAQSAREQATQLEKASAALTDIQGEARSAAQSLGVVDLSQKGIAESSRRTADAIQKVSDALARQQATIRSTTTQGGQGAAAQATQGFRDQIEAVNAAERAWRAAREEANRLGREIAETANPTAELRAAFVVAQQASQQAGRAYNEQRQALQQLRAAVRENIAATAAKKAADAEAAVAAAASADRLSAQARAAQAAAVAARLLRTDTEGLNRSLAGTAGAANTATQGINRFGDGSRRALSLVQRFRGEVLSLATNFVGLYAAIQGIGGVISAIRTVETAASRLNAVFGGDEGRIRNELRFISQEADRLGLSFQVLSQEFGRFAIAADAANFSNEATREIFESVAVAARVNKVTTEELEGTYLALQQIISKGVVSMEELRRQLGDRLPGAFNIFADALGVSTAELTKMIEAGEVVASEQTLLAFARELQERFGGALPAAIRTTTAELDRFSNNILEAQIRVAQGGFDEALREGLEKLNEFFRSREGRDFFLQLGALLGNFVRLLTFVAENFGVVITVIQTLISLRVAQFFLGIATQMRATSIAAKELQVSFFALNAEQQKQAIQTATSVNAFGAFTGALRLTVGALGQLIAAFVTTGAASNTTAVAAARMGAAFAALRVAAVGLLASLGPLVVVTGLVFGVMQLFGQTATSVTDATQALDEHTRQLDEYEQEVNEATRAGRDFNASLVDTTPQQALANLSELIAAYQGLKKEAGDTADEIIASFRRQNAELANNPAVARIQELSTALQAGEITVKEFDDAMRQLFGELDDPILVQFAAQVSNTTSEVRQAEQAMGTQAAMAQRLGADIGNLDETYQRIGIVIDSVSGKIRTFTNDLEDQQRVAAQQASAFADLERQVPRLARQQERSNRLDAIDAAAASAREGVTDADRLREIQSLQDEARAAALRDFEEEDRRELARGTRTRRRRDEQAEYNKDLAAANDLRRFEISLIGESVRVQEVRRAIFEAEQRALDRGVRLTQEQRDEIEQTVGARFDATEAERVQNLILEQQIRLRQAIGDEITVQAEIEEQARQQSIDLLTEEGQRWAEVTRQIIERERAEEQLKRMVEDVTALERQRQEAQRDFLEAQNNGETAEQLAARQAALDQQAAAIIAARDAAILLAESLGDEEALARLQRINTELEIQKQLTLTAAQANDMLAQGLTGAFDKAAAAIAGAIDKTHSWSDAIGLVGDAFRQFAADFLRQIAQMITQALILRAIQGSGLGGLISGGTNVLAGTAHGGGIAGALGNSRKMPSWVFARARRYHDGGQVGLRRDEVPAVLKRGEEVLTENNPRHANNMGGAGRSTKIVNVFRPEDILAAALSTAAGEEVLMNFVNQRKDAFNAAVA